MDKVDRRNFFTITAYGIHSKYHKIIERKIENEFKTKSVYVYEYFFDTPFVRTEGRQEVISSFEPFLLRILNEQKFIPEIPEGKNKIKNYKEAKSLPFTFGNIWKFWKHSKEDTIGSVITDLEKYTFIGKDLFKVWQNKKKTEKDPRVIEYEKSTGIVTGNFQIPIQDLREQYLKDISKFEDETSYVGTLKEYLTVVLPWLSLNDAQRKNLNIAAISLSTEKIFYGVILIFYPDITSLDTNKGIFINEEKHESNSIKYIKEIITSVYTPILALYENFWEEKKFREQLDSSIQWDEYIFLRSDLRDSSDDMEKAFHGLWTQIKETYESAGVCRNLICRHNRGKENIKKWFLENLVFSKYLIASPGMVEEFKKVVAPRGGCKKKDYLPCVLVIGEAGSGKEKMARLIPFFFPEYRFGERYIINMAALKPGFLSVPLMSGSDMEFTIDGRGEKATTLLLRGIFKKIWDQHKTRYPGIAKEKGKDIIRKKGLMPVVILDELNSLDIDAQGSLLRVLENASLQPLGGIKDEKVDFLVIGIVNEPEEVLTLREPLQKFLTERSIFGGVLGKALYEHFRSMRRLRDDLYYRFIREGKIRIPNLSERRMDIPILFTFFLVDEIPEEIGWKNLWVDFDVFEELMKETISWSGNFRELQSVAKRTAQYALSDKNNRKVMERIKNNGAKNDDDDSKPFRVSYENIERVMQEFFPSLDCQAEVRKYKN